MLLTLSGRSFIKNQVQFFTVIPRGVPLTQSNAFQYYVKCENCKVNDFIFPSGFEARAIKLDNKNMKISIFTGGTSVRSENIFIAFSRYPTGKHDINLHNAVNLKFKVTFLPVSLQNLILFNLKKYLVDINR